MPVLQEGADDETIISQPGKGGKGGPTSKSREFFEEQIENIL